MNNSKVLEMLKSIIKAQKVQSTIKMTTGDNTNKKKRDTCSAFLEADITNCTENFLKCNETNLQSVLLNYTSEMVKIKKN